MIYELCRMVTHFGLCAEQYLFITQFLHKNCFLGAGYPHAY